MYLLGYLLSQVTKSMNDLSALGPLSFGPKEIIRTHSIQLTVHKFKELVDHSFEEFPMSSEKSRILANHIHDIGCNDGLIVFPPLLFTETKQILQQKHTAPTNVHKPQLY